ncbi:MAG: PIN domain-containing protein [Methylococcaceae bacterium]
MVLVDTSVWVDHLRYKDGALFHLLEQGRVCIHFMIIGELACGHLQNREQLISLWKNLPHVSEANHDEALFCLDTNWLMGRGIGFIDLHLIASTLLTPDTLLWTKDRRLNSVAQFLHVNWIPDP